MHTYHWYKKLVILFITLLTFNIAAAEQTKILRIGYQKYGPLLLLKAKGTLEKRLSEQGVQVKWIEFPGGPQLLEGLNVGSVDLGVTGETPPIFAQAAGADLVYIANEPPAPQSEAILVSNDSPIQTVNDLKGKKIALNKGSNVHYLLVRALEEAGLNYIDINPVYLNPSDARAAFESNKVDAWVIWDPFQAAAEVQLAARTLKTGAGLVDNHQFYIAARPYAESNPQIITAVIEEIRDIENLPKNSPEQATDIISPVIGLSKEITLLSIKRQEYGAAFISPEVIQAQQKIADTFYRLKLIPKKLTINDVIWNPPTQTTAKQITN